METHRHSLRQVDGGHRFAGLAVEQHQLALVAAAVVLTRRAAR